jgi:hypothetical protein
MWTKFVVAEAPPPFCHSECEVDPPFRPCPFEEYQQSTWNEPLLHVLHRLPKIRSRVQNVGSHNDIVTIWAVRTLFYVERLIPHERILRESLLSSR